MRRVKNDNIKDKKKFNPMIDSVFQKLAPCSGLEKINVKIKV